MTYNPNNKKKLSFGEIGKLRRTGQLPSIAGYRLYEGDVDITKSIVSMEQPINHDNDLVNSLLNMDNYKMDSKKKSYDIPKSTTRDSQVRAPEDVENNQGYSSSSFNFDAKKKEDYSNMHLVTGGYRNFNEDEYKSSDFNADTKKKKEEIKGIGSYSRFNEHQYAPDTRIAKPSNDDGEPSSLAVALKSFLSGTYQAGSGALKSSAMLLKSMFGNPDMESGAVNKAIDIIGRNAYGYYEDKAQAVRNDLGELKGFKRFLQEGIEPIPQIVASALIGGATGTGILPFATMAGGSYAREAELEGASPMEQFGYGFTGGVIEGVSEKLVLNKVLGIFNKAGAGKLVNKGAKNFIGKYGKPALDILAGIGEEVAQEIVVDPLSGVAKKAIYNHDMPVYGEGGIVDPSGMLDTARGALSMSLILTALGLPVAAKSHMIASKQVENKLKNSVPIGEKDISELKEAMIEDFNSLGINDDATEPIVDNPALEQSPTISNKDKYKQLYNITDQEIGILESLGMPVNDNGLTEQQIRVLMQPEYRESLYAYNTLQGKFIKQRKVAHHPVNDRVTLDKFGEVEVLNDDGMFVTIKNNNGWDLKIEKKTFNELLVNKEDSQNETLESPINEKVTLEKFGEVEIINDDGAFITVKNKNGWDLKIGKKTFNELLIKQEDSQNRSLDNPVDEKVTLHKIGEVKVLNDDGMFVTIKNKNGWDLKLDKKTFDELLVTEPIKESQATQEVAKILEETKEPVSYNSVKSVNKQVVENPKNKSKVTQEAKDTIKEETKQENIDNNRINNAIEQSKNDFKVGERVQYKDKNRKTLTGTVKGIDDYSRINPSFGVVADIDVDQISTYAGGVPIGRREMVPISMLETIGEVDVKEIIEDRKFVNNDIVTDSTSANIADTVTNTIENLPKEQYNEVKENLEEVDENVRLAEDSGTEHKREISQTVQEPQSQQSTETIVRSNGGTSRGSVRSGTNSGNEKGNNRQLPDKNGGSSTSQYDGNGTSNGDSEQSSTREGEVIKTGDYRIKEDDILFEGGKKTRYKNNIEAIKLVKKLELEGRTSTTDEQKKLIKYVGWGGIAEVFDKRYDHITKSYIPAKDDWKKEFNELKELLSEEEYSNAASSTQNAFYTHPHIIKSVYNILDRLGFKGGNILEPSMGTGHFFGLLPDKMVKRSKLVGVEKDKITGLISKHLYQNADVRIKGLEETNLPDNYFDVAIGNVPFGNIRIYDPQYKHEFITHRIHNYFFAKALDKIKPSGLVAFITSSGTMNASDETAIRIRTYINTKADLIGAIRLPNDTFKKNAGTEVTTDLIILRKRLSTETPSGESWINTVDSDIKSKYGEALQINEYFVKYPEMMLGKLVEDKLFQGRLALESDGRDLMEALEKATESFPKNIFNAKKETIPILNPEEQAEKLKELKEGSFFIEKNKVLQKKDNQIKEVTGTMVNKIKGLVTVKDAVREVLSAQLVGKTDAVLKGFQKKLNSVYDSFVKKYGHISDKKNKRVLKEDPDNYLLNALEKEDSQNETIKKADIFTQRTIKLHKKITQVDNAKDAMLVTLNEVGYLDIDRMSDLVSKSNEEVINELKGLIYKNPEGDYETAEEYLSGNVRYKLEIAKEAVKLDETYKVNVEALEKVQPIDLKASEIDVKLGASWIPIDDYKTYISELLNLSSWQADSISISYNRYNSSYSIGGHRTQLDASTQQKWGTPKVNPILLIENAMNMRKTIVKINVYEHGVKIGEKVDEVATQAAIEKQNQIKTEFTNWIWKDQERRERLTAKYNKEFNNLKARVYDGTHLTLPGLNQNISLRPHQISAIARVVHGGNTLLAHAVGAGKTWEMIVSGMELKRMGLANKNMFVVPNNMLGQFKQDFNLLYPQAKVLFAEEDDFNPKNLKSLMARIATNEWDAIVLRHASFSKIPVSKETLLAYYSEQINEVEMAIVEAYEGKDKNITKQLEKAKDNLKTKLKEIENMPKYDIVTFEEMGVDQVFVDEAHEFKNLRVYTKLNRVKGVQTTGGKTTDDFYAKVRYMAKINNGKRGIVFATGTPISNSMVELYTMFRYLRLDLLRERNIDSFDSWASTFGEIVSTLELTPTGQYRTTERFKNFVNVPELITLFREFADIKMSDSLKLPKPELEGDKPIAIKCPAHPDFEFYRNDLIKRMEQVKKGGKPEKGADNALSVATDARKAATDMRLVNSGIEDSEDTKINIATTTIFDLWKETKDRKATQLVFLNLGATKDEAGNVVFDLFKDLKQKLIDKGIPENEVAFARDYKKNEQKTMLYRKMNNGEIRVLIGSNAIMGTGLNVQKKLYAIHEIDVPYRPSDLEQGEGRMLRQGNEHKELNIPVRIYRYLTEGSFDAYMWQIIENKRRSINQIMKGDTTIRKVEAEDDVVLTDAEMKAIASGNPLIMEKVKTDAEVQRLNMLKQSYMSNLFDIQDSLARLPVKLQYNKDKLSKINEDIKTRQDIKGNNFKVIINKKEYTKREDAGIALRVISKHHNSKDPVKVGKVAGFDLYIQRDRIYAKNMFKLLGKGEYDFDIDGLTDAGIFQRIESLLTKFDVDKESVEYNIENITRDLGQLQEEVKKPFEHAEKLEEALSEQRRINAALDVGNTNQAEIVKTNSLSDEKDSELEDDEDGTGKIQAYSPLSRITTRMKTQRPANNQSVNTTASNSRDAKKIKTIDELVEMIENTIGVPIRTGKFRQRALGIFKVQPEVIRTKITNDMPTISHELGHYFDKHNNLSQTQFSKELIPLGNATSKKGYSGARRRQEGVAEFVRLYITDPATATTKAPKFLKHFEATMTNDVLAFLGELRHEILKIESLPTHLQTKNDISFFEKRTATKLDNNSWFEKLTGAWLDEQLPFKRLQKEIGNVSSERNFALKADLYKGVEGKVKGNLTLYQTDLEGNKVGESLQSILKPIKGKEYKDFANYMVSRRAIDYEDKGFVLPQPYWKYQENVIYYDKESSHFKGVFDEIRKWENNNLQLLVDAGIMSQNTVDDIIKNNPNHIPLYRIQEAVENYKAGSGNSLGKSKNVVKRAKGGGQTIIDPIESLVVDAYIVRSVADANDVLCTLANQAERTDGLGWAIEKIPPKVKGMSFEVNDIKKALEDMGIDTTNVDLTNILSIFKANYSPRANEVRIYREGKPELYQLDPELYKAIKGLNREASHFILRTMSKAKGVLQTGVVTSVKFIMRNIARDTGTALVNSEADINPFDLIKGYISAVRKDEWYQRYVQSGGNSEWIQPNDRKQIQHAVRGIMNQGFSSKFADILLHPFLHMRDFIEPTEAGPRVSEFRKTVEKTGDEILAAQRARDITIDFKQHGYYGKEVNKITAFFNANVQGQYKMARTFMKHPYKTMLKGFVYITLPTLILHAINDDNEEYQSMSIYRKALFYNIPIDGGKKFISIPKPFDWGVIFGAVPEFLLDEYKKNDKKAYKNIMESIQLSFGGDLMPQAIKPYWEAHANKDWKNKSIENMGDQRVSPYLRYDDRTSTVAKTIANAVKNLPIPDDFKSPKKLDYMIKGYFGTLGAEIRDIPDKYEDMLKNPFSKDKDISEMPVVGAFITTPLDYPSEITEFFDEYYRLQTLYNDSKKNRVKMSKEDMSKYNRLKHFYKNIDKIYERINTIEKDKKLDNEQKEGLIEKQKLRVREFSRKALDKKVSGE